MKYETLFAGAVIYLLCLLGFLIPLKRIPKVWRLAIFTVFCAVNIGFAFICRCFNFITFHLQSGERALKFFTELSEELAHSTMSIKYLPIGILDIQTPHSEKRYISDSNALRKKTYLLIEQKRKENVSNKQISEAIKANLKDFRYTYENREDEKESSGKIEPGQ